MLFADVLIDFHDVSADGTLVTTAILANCERSTETAGFDATPTPSTSITLGPHATNMLDAVTIGTGPSALTVYPASHTSRSIHQNNAISNEQIKLWLDPSLPSGTHTKFSWGGWITFGPTNAGGSASLYDYCVMAEGGGRTSTFQLSNGLSGSGTGYGVNIESVIATAVSHSNYIQVTPGATYWCTHMCDFVANVTKAMIFDVTGALVGSIATILDSGAGTSTAYLLIGNNEAGAQGGTSVFENFLVAYTNPVFPLGPSALAVTAPVYTSSPAFVRKRLAKQYVLGSD